MKEATDFYYAGQYSVDLGIIQCHVDVKGLLEEPFLPEQTLNTISIRGRDRHYYVDSKRSPLVIDLEFAFEDAYDEDSLREVARLFANQNYYQEFYTTLNTNRRFMCMYTGSPILSHNSLSNGIVKMQLTCDGPYSYSPEYLSSVIKTSEQDICATGSSGLNLTMTGHLLATGDYIVNVTRNDAIRQVSAVPDVNNVTLDSTVTGQIAGDVIDKYTGTSVQTTFSNNSDLTILPEIEFKKIGTGSISIINTTYANKELVFDSLVNGEYLYVDCSNEIVLSDQTGVYRYSNLTATSEFLQLVRGDNILTLSGNFTTQFRYRFLTLG